MNPPSLLALRGVSRLAAAKRLWKSTLVLALVCAVSACDRVDVLEILGEVRPWDGGGPRPGVTAIPFETFRDSVGDRAGIERRVLIKSAEAYTSFFGHAPPAGVDMSRDWVIFYAAGRRNTGGFVASVQALSLADLGRETILQAVTRLESPGRDCAVTDAVTTPFVLVKFRAQPGTPSVDFARSDTVRSCGVTTNPCAAILCLEGTECVVLETYPPQARCVPITPQPGPCATIKCASGTHCEAQQVVCVRAPCPPIGRCVADQPPVRCGGFAGIRCPGAGICEDDPSDSCDPRRGGADCGGLCACRSIGDCQSGSWDSNPAVCACAPTRP